MGTFLDESFLLSAYDLYHQHFRQPQRFYKNTALIFLDSGAYELNPEFDSSEPKLTPVRDADFERENYLKILRSLKKKYEQIPFVISNFDWGTRYRPFIEQIRDARQLMHEFAHWSTNIILKPNKPKGTVLHVDQVVPIIDEIRDFDIIGVTEKELGKNLIERLKRLVKLRLELSSRNVTAPIHVWGGLDPLITPLYFFAGADIFDGVSWLRYAYYRGMAVNRQSVPVLNGNLTSSHDHSVALAQNTNLVAIQGMATSLRAFANSDKPNFEMFEERGKLLEKAYRTMQAKIPRLKELS